jgi:hypothetical protein
MGEHSTTTSLNLIDFLTSLGDGLCYYTDTEFPMNEKSFGGQAIDIAWFNEEGSKFPLFIFEIESTSNNSIANNPTKIFGKDSKVFEKPLFFFHIIIDGAENSEKYSDLIGLFGKYNYDIFRINNGDVENLLLKIISQHRRIHNEIDLRYLIQLIYVTDAIKSQIKFERFLTNVENLIHENQFYRIGQVYADIASCEKSFQEQYSKFLYRSLLSKKTFYLSYENYSASIASEFVNLGILYSSYKKELNNLDFTSLLIEAQKTETFNKIEYLPGLNHDYDIFIHDHVPFYIALTFFLFDGNVNAQRYIIDTAIKIIRKLKIAEDYIFEHHVSWGLLMSSSNEEFSKIYQELRDLTNKRNRILNTILYCPTFMNDHHELPDSILMIVPDRNEYIEELKHKFEHLNNVTDINEIAIMSLSEYWKDTIEYNVNLGFDLTNYVVKKVYTD